MDKRAYVVDIGTNSVRLMYAKIEKGTVTAQYKTIRTVRTGEGVNQTKQLAPAAIERTIGALLEFRALVEKQPAPVYCFATSAVRDSKNREQFQREVHLQVGWQVDILSGQQEAWCGFIGAVGQTGGIIDIGGGSTEIVFGREGKIAYQHSFNIGTVRGLELFHEEKDRKQLVDWGREPFKTVPWKQAEGLDFYAIGGTATSLAAIDLSLEPYDAEKVQGYCLKQSRVEEMVYELSNMTLEERRKVIGLEEKRSDVILYGAAILQAFFQISGRDRVWVSEADNMEGYLMWKKETDTKF